MVPNFVNKVKHTFDKIKDIVKQYFTELANILGFDPTTKNLADLSLNEMLELAVSEDSKLKIRRDKFAELETYQPTAASTTSPTRL